VVSTDSCPSQRAIIDRSTPACNSSMAAECEVHAVSRAFGVARGKPDKQLLHAWQAGPQTLSALETSAWHWENNASALCLTGFPQPRFQDSHGRLGQWRASLFAPFAHATHMSSRAQGNIMALEAGQFDRRKRLYATSNKAWSRRPEPSSVGLGRQQRINLRMIKKVEPGLA